MVVGQVVIAAALFMVAFGPSTADYFANLLLPMVMLGLGGGLTFPALTMIAMSSVEPTEVGLASGLLNTTGQVGGALGLAVLATVATITSGTNPDAARGFHAAWLVAAVIVVTALIVTLATLRPRPAIAAECEILEEAA
jgi:MFS family permease